MLRSKIDIVTIVHGMRLTSIAVIGENVSATRQVTIYCLFEPNDAEKDKSRTTWFRYR
jgi:hypothetical protein